MCIVDPSFVLVCANTFLLDIHNPYPELFRGCLALSATKIIYANWAMFTVMEGGTPSIIWLLEVGSLVPKSRSCPCFDDRQRIKNLLALPDVSSVWVVTNLAEQTVKTHPGS